jgi:pimeloyl-ACP methyl ester carboxylesterase
MPRAPLGDVELEYEARGSGDPVLFVHGGLCADWFRDLLGRPELAAHRLIGYHRAGYGGSGALDGPLGIRGQAAHARSLLRHLGVARAHVVGHSSGAAVALQLALDHPDAVRSLALLETALLAVPSGPFAGEAIGRYRAGDRAGAVDVWLRGVAGPGYRATLDRVLPGAFDQAVEDAGTFFGQELPAVRAWSFGPEDAARVRRPVLAVLGGRSGDVSPAFEERHRLLLDWLPAARPFVLPGATHLLHVDDPGGMAAELARFFADVAAADVAATVGHEPVADR